MSHYICGLNEKVERVHVRYQNRYGLMIAGDLYTAVDLDRAGKHPALIVGAPYGGIKEQGPAVYANELAQRGLAIWAKVQASPATFLPLNCSLRISVRV